MSTATAAPVDPAAFLQKFQDNGLTKGQKQDVQDAVNAHLNDSETRKNIYAELQRMGQSVVEMETDFAQVYTFVKRLDDQGVVLKAGKVIPFAPEWKRLHEEYQALMNESQATATKLRAKIHELLNVFLPLVGAKAPVGKKQKALTAYIQKLKTFTDEGNANATRFLRLREDVIRFKQDLEAMIPSQIKDLDAKLKELNAGIEIIKKRLGEISDFLATSWYKAGSTSGLSALINLAPQAAIGILGTALSRLGFSTMEDTMAKGAEKERKTKELCDIEKQRDDLNARREHLAEALTELNGLQGTFKDLISRLGAMEGIWKMLIADATSLQIGLESMDSAAADAEDVDDDWLYNRQMESVKAVYFTLQGALDAYALSVAPATK